MSLTHDRRPVLTETQARILALIEIGLENGEIAEVLRISRATLKSHIRAAYHRIGVASRAEAAAWVEEALLEGRFPRTALHGRAGRYVACPSATSGADGRGDGRGNRRGVGRLVLRPPDP
jgi:DNA-binding CsgD family transcriptional regulator